jgi:hypothetical protein
MAPADRTAWGRHWVRVRYKRSDHPTPRLERIWADFLRTALVGPMLLCTVASLEVRLHESIWVYFSANVA